MKTLRLKNKFQTNATLISNDFIDNYMIKANGEFVKVYLFLLRHLDDPYSTLTITTIADCLNNTENDILRAFRYWESERLLKLERDTDGRICGLELENIITAPKENPSREPLPEQTSGLFEEPSAPQTAASLPDTSDPIPVPAPKSKPISLNTVKAQKELKSLLFIAEQYMGKTLSKTDMDAICYFYETLGMSADLIEYLIETCVENGHKSIHYIQKVALSWADDGISTVEQARARSIGYNKNCYTVLSAFGIKNRAPGSSELTYIKRWTEEFGFTLDIIEEACSRTISAIHQPSFEYADTILEKWYKSQVHYLKDIAALDSAFQKEKLSRRASAPRQKTAAKNMNNFERRAYNMDALEEQLLKSN